MGGLPANPGMGGLPAPQQPGMISANGEQAGEGNSEEMALAVMMAAQQQLLLGQASPGGLAAANIAANNVAAKPSPQMAMWQATTGNLTPRPAKAFGKPSFTPKLNLAKNPCLPKLQQLGAATSKGPGLMKALMPGVGGPAFAKRPGLPSFPGQALTSLPAASPFSVPAAAPPEPDPPVESPEARAILERLGSIAQQTVLGTAPGLGKAAPSVAGFAKAFPAKAAAAKPICVKFEMGGCSTPNCPFSHDLQ